MSRGFRVLALTSLALLAAACGTDDSGDTGDTSADPTGRTFVSTTVEGTPIPGDGPLIVEFPEDGRISATAGCNRFAGAADLTGGVLRAPDLATTMMACAPPVDGADGWLTGLLGAEPRWELVGDDLTLVTDEISVTLSDKKVVDPDLAVVGTEWVLTSWRTADAVSTSTAAEHSPATLTLADDGTAFGSTGCNRFNGSAQVHSAAEASQPGDGTIEFGPLATTRMACSPELSELEAHVLGVLEGTVTYVVDGSTLTITAVDGVRGLEFAAR